MNSIAWRTSGTGTPCRPVDPEVVIAGRWLFDLLTECEAKGIAYKYACDALWLLEAVAITSQHDSNDDRTWDEWERLFRRYPDPEELDEFDEIRTYDAPFEDRATSAEIFEEKYLNNAHGVKYW